MRISDWSSDVCSSDLPSAGLDRSPLHHERIVGAQHIDAITQARSLIRGVDQDLVAVTQRGLHRLSMNMDDRQARALGPGQLAQPAFVKAKIGSASCRERVCESV